MATDPLVRSSHVHSKTLWRLTGLSAMLGGVLFVTGHLLSFVAGTEATGAEDFLRWGILGVASALVLGGLIGVYGIQARESGVLGLVAFVVSFVGVLLTFGFFWGGVVIVPEILDTPFIEEGPERAAAIWILRLRVPLMTIGLLLVAVATLRAGVLSRIGAWLLVVGTAAGAISTLGVAALLRPGAVLGGIGFAWLGWSVIRVSGAQKITTP